MNGSLHALECLGRASGIGIGISENDQLTSVFGVNDSNPLWISEDLRKLLLDRCDMQTVPVIYRDQYGVVFAAIRDDGICYFFGPLPYKSLSPVELAAYFRYYGIRNEFKKLIHGFTMAQIVAVVALAAEITIGVKYSYEELARANDLLIEDDDTLLGDRVQHYIDNEERIIHHHTYAEELAILQCVEQGKTQEVQEKSLAMDRIVGRLSQDELTHWKYSAVAAITLCARAAISGGVSPAAVYHDSDYYIRRLDGYNTISEVIALRNKAIYEITDQVNQKKKDKTEGYVARCIDYICQHYREKIYIDDIASGLGLSANYLSKLFVRETGVKLQDYIVQHRVERSAGLLRYSDMSIADIAIYVGFPSQSYFGKVFKQYKGLTPLKYRETYRPREFGNQVNL